MTHPHGGPAPFHIALTVILIVMAWVYVRGWLRLRSLSPGAVVAGRAASFLVGLLLIWVAVASPLATRDRQWLTVHMVQHLLLMSVASPLIWLGAPIMSLLHGLPRRGVTAIVGPLCGSQSVQRIGAVLAQPAICWLGATVALVGWHVPAALALGMQSHAWHFVRHASFLATGLLFWWPIVRPWPSARTESQWWMVLYLFLATLPCDALSAFLVFSERVAYPNYVVTSGRTAASVLEDQQYAGALMWTCITIIYLTAGAMLTVRLLAAPTLCDRDQQRLESV